MIVKETLVGIGYEYLRDFLSDSAKVFIKNNELLNHVSGFIKLPDGKFINPLMTVLDHLPEDTLINPPFKGDVTNPDTGEVEHVDILKDLEELQERMNVFVKDQRSMAVSLRELRNQCVSDNEYLGCMPPDIREFCGACLEPIEAEKPDMNNIRPELMKALEKLPEIQDMVLTYQGLALLENF